MNIQITWWQISLEAICCKIYSIHSITLYLLMYVVKVVLIAFGLAEMGFL